MKVRGSLPSDVCAIVISFHPDIRIVQNVAALLEQLGTVFVIDNGSTGESQEQLNTIRHMPGCHVHFLGENLGIAAAMNKGVKLAVEGGFQFIFTFDQDSSITSGFVERMLNEYSANYGSQKIGLIFPRYVDPNNGKFLRPLRDGDGNPYTAMTSGNLIRASTFKECGGYEESFFIDYVDHEFCLRLRNYGYSIVECSSAVLQHSLGNLRTYSVFGVRFGCTHHNPGRRYYMTRNRIWIYRRFLIRHWKWCNRDILSMFQELVKLVLFEEHRTAKLSSVLRGIQDGLSGRMGKTVDL